MIRNGENIENTTDPTCSGTVIVHWDAYVSSEHLSGGLVLLMNSAKG